MGIFAKAFLMLMVCCSLAWAHLKETPTEPGIADKKIEMILEPVVIRVTGYGAYDGGEKDKSEAKRLMAIRASKLDAYRALAERIYGIGISGTSSVKDFVLKSDGFGAAVDSYVRGARVVSIMENKVTGFETVLEVLLPGDFQDCLNKVNNFKYGMECLRPLTQSSLSNAEPSIDKRSAGRKMQSMYYLD